MARAGRFGLLMLALACLPAEASRTVPLALDYFEDPGRQLTIEQVLRGEGGLLWKRVEGDNPRFGYSRSRFWFRFRLPKDELPYGPNEGFFLEIPYVYLSRVELFTTEGGELLRSSASGLAVPRSERNSGVLKTSLPVFRIPTVRSHEETYYLSVEADFPVSVPLRLYAAPDFAYHHWTGMFALGMFFGLLVLAALFNGFLALSLRNWTYLCYALFVSSLTILYLAHEGLTVQFFWPNAPWWALREMHLWGGFALLFYALFVREFLATAKTTPWLDRLLFALVGISSVRSIWLMFGHNQLVAMLGETAILFSNVLVLVISAVALRRGVRTARYFLLSSVAFNLAMILFLLHETNVIWVGSFVAYAPHFGTAAEVILLSLALADRIRQTNRELAEQRAAMILSDKLTALGRMAGEVAHEINNPLAIIHANAVLLREHARELPTGSFNWSGVATTIEQTSNRISKVVKGMRALSRDCRNDPKSNASLQTILQDCVSVCQERYARNGVELSVKAQVPDIILHCRSSDICQVIVNLLHNALDAVEATKEKRVTLAAATKDGRLEISVEDSGGGIAPDLRRRVLEPFFTTKEPGKGLGLGLSISRTIVESHGGKLWLDETSPCTRFVFSIPGEDFA